MTTTTKTENALDRFVGKTRDLFARRVPTRNSAGRSWVIRSSPESFWPDPTTVEASKKWPDCTILDGRVENLLFYEDPDFKFAVNGLVVHPSGEGLRDDLGASTTTRTSTRSTACSTAVQRIERYERVDDGTKPDYAEIRQTFDSTCSPGEIDLVRPFEIHAEETVGERAVAVIIRSEKSGSFLQGRYLPDEKLLLAGLRVPARHR